MAAPPSPLIPSSPRSSVVIPPVWGISPVVVRIVIPIRQVVSKVIESIPKIVAPELSCGHSKTCHHSQNCELHCFGDLRNQMDFCLQKISHTDQGRSKCVYIYIKMCGCVLVIRETSNKGHLHRLRLGKWPFIYWRRTYCVHLDQEISLTDTNYDHYTSIDETWMRLRPLYL